MDQEMRAAEEAIKKAWVAGDMQKAATLALEVYGAEILAFLSARLRNAEDGREAFSMFVEDFWKGLPSFEWRCSMRGWAYTVARNAANRLATAPHVRREQPLTSSRHPLSRAAEQVRTATPMYRKTQPTSRLRALRERLSVEEQTLLVLYVDRRLPWNDIAVIMSDGDTIPDERELARVAARLRKRLERIKARLKTMAEEEGLLEQSDADPAQH